MRVASHELSSATASSRSSIANLIVPLDGSELSRTAIPLVCRLMEVYQATPHLLYAGASTDTGTMLSRVGVEWQQLPGAVIHQPNGAAAESVLHLAKQLPDAAIVMCTHTGHNSQPNCFGSVTEAVLAGNPEVIVLVVPEFQRESFTLERIVLAHDGTPTAAVAARYAGELAHRSRAEVLAVHVAAPRTVAPEESGSLPAPQYVDQPQHEWPSWTGEFSSRLLALGVPVSSVKFKVMVVGGQPGSELAQLARAKKVDMMVLANSGDWKHCRHNLVRAVIRGSGCPVMLVSCAAHETE